MRTKAFITIIAALSFLALAGWGCKSSVPPEAADTSDEISETSPTFLTYENGEFGFEFRYPEAWDLRVTAVEPFDWSGNRYELVDIQLRERSGEYFISVYSFAIAANAERLSLREWLLRNNRTGEALELVDTNLSETLSGIEIQSLTSEIISPDERAFPGALAFSDPENKFVFFPDFGQEQSVFEDYGITASDFENQIFSTLTF